MWKVIAKAFMSLDVRADVLHTRRGADRDSKRPGGSPWGS
jgi:hypothetical protein